jgi:peptidoglycan hydrolase-like protein with peptidoglycan-binding domain
MPSPLQYKPFASCTQLVSASRKNPVLRVGRYGPGVRLIQGALLDLGYALPRSSRKGGPDGIFGHETEQMLLRYQQDVKLQPDGVLGPATLLALDRAMFGRSKRLPFSKPAAIKLPMSLEYMVGRDIPPIPQDAGAGPWRSKSSEYCYRALKDAIVEALPHAASTFGPDAARHLTHFFTNTGNPIHIDLRAMLNQVPSARSLYRDEFLSLPPSAPDTRVS